MAKDERNRTNRIWTWIAVGFALILVAAAAVWSVSRMPANQRQRREEMAQTLSEVSVEGVQGVFFGTYPLDTYHVEDFLTYRGYETVMLPFPLKDGGEAVDFLSRVLETPHSLEAVYMALSKEGTGGIGAWIKQHFGRRGGWEQELCELVKAHPEQKFYIMLEYPSIAWLAELSSGERTALWQWYREMAELFTADATYNNIVLSMPGAESWLTCNPAHYTESGEPDEVAARFVLGQVTCLDKYQLDKYNVEQKLAGLDAMLAEYGTWQQPRGGYTYVFFGDSVIGNYTDSFSIPEVVQALTGVPCMNLGYGGLSAAQKDGEPGIKDLVDAFLQGDNSAIEDDKPVKEGIAAFHESQEIREDKLVFFLSLGINDYMASCPLEGDRGDVSTFTGAMEYAVNALKEAYPESDVVLMTPNFLGVFDNGTEVHEGHVYKDYVDAVVDLSIKLGVGCVDVYGELDIHGGNKLEYLADQCHPNEKGRFEIGKLVSIYAAQQYPQDTSQ